jgi:prophage antirepressor-like protein
MSKLTPIIPFSFEGQDLRVVMRGKKPWFVAADVCAALNVKDVSMACARLDDDEADTSSIGIRSVTGVIQDREVVVINESGLYSLTLTSRKPEAKRFKKWVTNEVLVSIRETGAYSISKEVSLPTNYIAALEDLLASKKAEALALGERDHAIRTKHLIGNKREATAMATASVAVREVKRLRDELGFSARHATVLQVEHVVGCSLSFVPLRAWCKANDIVAMSVPDKRYPKGVKAWPAGAWSQCYDIDISALFKFGSK